MKCSLYLAISTINIFHIVNSTTYWKANEMKFYSMRVNREKYLYMEIIFSVLHVLFELWNIEALENVIH